MNSCVCCCHLPASFFSRSLLLLADGELVRQLLLEDDDDLKAVVENLENAETIKVWRGVC